MTLAAPSCITRLAVALLVCGVISVHPCQAQEPAAADFVDPYFDKDCDDANRSWLVLNRHTHLSIQVTIQWHPIGGEPKEETMVLSPQQRRPVGCAPTVNIVSAQLMAF